MRCKTCHYSLANLTEHRCPECGSTFDPNDPSTFDRPSRPTIWHALLLFVAFFVGGAVIVLMAPSARSNLNSTFGTVQEQVRFALRLIALISAALTTIIWLVWYLRWRRSRC